MLALIGNGCWAGVSLACMRAGAEFNAVGRHTGGGGHLAGDEVILTQPL